MYKKVTYFEEEQPKPHRIQEQDNYDLLFIAADYLKCWVDVQYQGQHPMLTLAYCVKDDPQKSILGPYLISDLLV